MPALECPAPNKIVWLRKTRSVSASTNSLIPHFRNIYDYLALGLAMLFFLRASILPILFPQTSRVLFWGVYGLLVLAIAIIIAFTPRKTLHAAGLVFVIAASLGCFFSPYPSTALLKGMGLFMLIIVLGPVLTSKNIAELRGTAWSVCRLMILCTGVISTFWYLLRLPVIGRGAFTGVYSHCMVVGPIAGMACLIAFLLAVERKSIPWAIISLFCIPPVLAAGSRIACFALVTGGLVAMMFLCYQYRFLFAAAVLPIILLVIFGAGSDVNISEDSALGQMTETLRSKGSKNTREEAWNARIEEFNEYPIFGMGIGVGYTKTEASKDTKNELINVEPGSSFLAIMSMTGSAGAMAFMLLSLSLTRRFWKKTSTIPPIIKAEVISLLAFLLMHAAAEGWMLGVGSLLCMLFWLALGYLYDLSSTDCRQI